MEKIPRHRKQRDLRRSGRPRVTTPRQDRQICLCHLRNRFRPATLTAAQTQGTHNNRISPQTVRNRLREAHMMARRPAYGGSFLTPPRGQNRVRWVRAKVRWPRQRWLNILFTDESRFRLFVNDGQMRVWRRRGESHANACVFDTDRFGRPSVMVWAHWAGIHFNDKTPLIFVQGNLTGIRYRDEILLWCRMSPSMT